MILLIEAFGYLPTCALLIGALAIAHRFGKLKRVKADHVGYTVTALLALVLCAQVLITGYVHRNAPYYQPGTYWTTEDGSVTIDVGAGNPGPSRYSDYEMLAVYGGELCPAQLDITGDYSMYAYIRVETPDGGYASEPYIYLMPNDGTLMLIPAIGNDTGGSVVLRRADGAAQDV